MARGSIVRRGGSYRIAVELPADPITGKRRQRFETFRGSKKEADKRLTELLSLADQQRLGSNPRMTLGDFLARWLQDHGPTLAPKTLRRYQDVIRLQVLPHLGSERLDRLTPSHFVRLLSTLRTTPRQDGKPGHLAPQTIKHTLRVLHVALESAVTWQLLPHNPADGVKPPAVPRKEMQTFTVEQARAFLEASASEGTMWETFFTVAMTTGLRLGELRGLRWQDVDTESGRIQVQQSVQRIDGLGMIYKPPKNPGSRRPVDIDAATVALLRKHRAEQNAFRLQRGPLWQDHDLVFASQVGTPIEDYRIHDAFTRICERASVPRIRPYDLRHSCASLLLAAGVHPKIVAERLGHSSVNLTLNTYSHVLPTLQRDAADTLGRLLKQGIS